MLHAYSCDLAPPPPLQGLGIVGAVIMPHNLYLHSGLVLVGNLLPCNL